MAGDFNHANIEKVRSSLFPGCGIATSGNNTLDLAYCNIKQAFRAASRPHLGSSDHLSAMLIPVYKYLLIRKKAHSGAGQVLDGGSYGGLLRPHGLGHVQGSNQSSQMTQVGEYAESVF